MKLVCVLLYTILLLCNVSDGAKILGLISTASISHNLPFRPLWRELSRRGHQVTVLTTDPMNDPSLTNLTEIDMHYTYKIYDKHNFTEIAMDDTKSFHEIGKVIAHMMEEASDAQLSSPEIQKLLKDKSVTFDLILTESQLPYMLGFVWRFKCPWIGIASLDAAINFHDSAGNPTHPIINPDNNLPLADSQELTFKERMISVIYNVIYKLLMRYRYYPKETARVKKYFGDDLPFLADIQNNMSMLFIGTNPIFHNIRPLNPNTVVIGNGMHILPPKPLPKEFQTFLDEAKEGVVYFSLGSNVKGRSLNETTRNAIMTTFAELPYKVIFKFDGELKNPLPKNVMVKKWVPQQDVLRHPNIKAFVTQGGLQSLQEAITNSIPLVAIPFFGDQIENVQKVVKRGFGVKLSKHNITKETLKSAILEVINNPIYKQNAAEMGALLHDEPMTSLDKAVWWTEYVIRHKGAPHLRSLSVDMPFYKYYMVDVLGFLFGILFASLYVLYKVVRCLCSLICKRKSKQKQQ